MDMYTTEQLKQGIGLYCDRPTKAFTYDGGKTWHTCEVNDGVRGMPEVCYVPPADQGGWEARA